MGQIFWLASYPRSGATRLRYFLYAYFKLDRGVGARIDLSDPGMGQFVTEDTLFDWWRPFFPKPCEEVRTEETSHFRRRSQEKIARATPGAVFVKTHAPYAADHGVELIMPHVSVGAHYVVRNPLDVAVSLKDHFGLANMGKAVQRINDPRWRIPSDERRVAAMIGGWSAHVNSWVGRHRSGVFTMRFEDMLDDPTKAFTYILDTLSRKPDRKQLEWAIEATSFENLAAAEREQGCVDAGAGGRFFREGRVNGWRDVLNSGQIKQIVAENHEMMAHCGYLDEDLKRYVPKSARA